MNVNKFINSKNISSRYLIHQILDGVFINRRTKPQTLNYLEKKQVFFEEKDIARAERITSFIFGHLESIDRKILKFLKKKTNTSVLNIFRIVISEIAFNDAPKYGDHLDKESDPSGKKRRHGGVLVRGLASEAFPELPINTSLKLWRQMISRLNRRLKTVEVNMCNQDFKSIVHKRVPGRAMRIYKDAFN